MEQEESVLGLSGMRVRFSALMIALGLFLNGCAEYVAAELTLAAVSAISDNSSKNKVFLAPNAKELDDKDLCAFATSFDAYLKARNWEKHSIYIPHVEEAKLRGLTCGVNQDTSTQVASLSNVANQSSDQSNRDDLSDAGICYLATVKSTTFNDGFFYSWKNESSTYVQEAKSRGLDCGVNDAYSSVSSSLSSNSLETWDDDKICSFAVYNDGEWASNQHIVSEAKRRGLTCGVNESSTTQVASSTPSTQSSPSTSAELLAAQQEAEALKQRLAELEAQQSQTQQATSADTQIPLITITRADTDDKQGIVAGRVSDNVGVAELTIDGNVVPVTSNGSFEYSTYVPATGLNVTIEVTDLAGLSSSQTITLERNVNLATASISFDRLNPISKPAKRNNNALALIIGVSDYRNTPAKAIYADTDAMVFRDYASEKLGIPDNRIKTLVNEGADKRELLVSINNWLSRSVKQDQTDVYVFFAGHGLASDDGQNMYLLPYDGSPEFLDDTAFLRDRIFSDIASANPRSVTVFLDTCYSGSNRGSEMLIAARPILFIAKESAVPEGFTVFTAAAGDETAKSLEEAKHGMFSYFLMKGMEGDADTNGDKQITAGELHAYVKSNVVQQSSGTQTPELQGDEDRVLVRFQ